MKPKLITAALVLLMTSGAAFGQSAFDPTQPTEALRKIAVANIWALTMMASEKKCPGVHVIKGSLRAITDEAGITEDQVAQGGLFSQLVSISLYSAQSDYDRDHAAWCATVWQLLGPDHPPMIKHMLLAKD